MGRVLNRVGRAVALCVLLSSTAVVGLAAPAVAETRSELVITYYAEPELQTVVGASWYCNGQPDGWGERTGYRTYERNDFC